jgi:S1-C subfamily serine protease
MPHQNFGRRLNLFALPIALSMTQAILGCGSDEGNNRGSRNPNDGPRLLDLPPGVFDQLKDPADVPAPLAAAARAVVKIERPSGVIGTGFFIGDGRTLVTNAHVLGPESCFLEGCTLRLHFGHYRGAGDPDSRWVTVVPYAFRPGIDFAAYRTVDAAGDPGKGFVSTDRLQLAGDAEQNLLSSQAEVALAGHSSGQLLKFALGRVAFASGAFISSELLTLPGSSGGPLLNVEGQAVALHHRGTQNLDYLRNTGYFGVSLATRSSVVLQALNDPLRTRDLEAFRSQNATTSAELLRQHADAVASSTQFGAVSPSNDGGAAAETLWTLCATTDESQGDGSSREAPAAETPSLRYCRMAAWLLECSNRGVTDEQPDRSPLHCPSDDKRSLWLQRFEGVGRQTREAERAFWMLRAPLQLFPQSERSARAQALVKQWLSSLTSGGKSLNVDEAAMAMDVLRQSKVNSTDFAKAFASFRSVPKYYFQYQDFLRGLFILGRDGHLPLEQVDETLKATRQDPNATLGDVLVADELLWRLLAVRAGILNGLRSDSPWPQ